MSAAFSSRRFLTLDLRPSRFAIAWRGILLLLLGILLLLRPALTIQILTIGIGFLLIFDGAWMAAASRRAKSAAPRKFMLINGLLTIALGCAAIFAPLMVNFAWAMLIGLWLLLCACGDFRGRQFLSAAGNALIGGIFIFLPAAGVLTVSWMLGTLLAVLGVLMLLIAYRMPQSPATEIL